MSNFAESPSRRSFGEWRLKRFLQTELRILKIILIIEETRNRVISSRASNESSFLRRMHDGAPVHSDGRFEVLSVEGASSLRISPVMMEDEGGVACEANNPAGRSRTDAKLSVHGKRNNRSLNSGNAD